MYILKNLLAFYVKMCYYIIRYSNTVEPSSINGNNSARLKADGSAKLLYLPYRCRLFLNPDLGIVSKALRIATSKTNAKLHDTKKIKGFSWFFPIGFSQEYTQKKLCILRAMQSPYLWFIIRIIKFKLARLRRAIAPPLAITGL